MKFVIVYICRSLPSPHPPILQFSWGRECPPKSSHFLPPEFRTKPDSPNARKNTATRKAYVLRAWSHLIRTVRKKRWGSCRKDWTVSSVTWARGPHALYVEVEDSLHALGRLEIAWRADKKTRLGTPLGADTRKEQKIRKRRRAGAVDCMQEEELVTFRTYLRLAILPPCFLLLP